MEDLLKLPIKENEPSKHLYGGCFIRIFLYISVGFFCYAISTKDWITILLTLVLLIVFWIVFGYWISYKTQKMRAEDSNVDVKLGGEEIHFSESYIVIDKGEKITIPLENIKKFVIYSSFYNSVTKEFQSGWGKIKIKLKNGKTKEETFYLKEEKEQIILIDLLRNWYAQGMKLKERCYFEDEALLLFRSDWEYEEMAQLKKELGIKSIY